MKKLLLFCLQLLSIGFLFAQEGDNKTKYNPQDFYLTTFNPTAGNEFRSAKGTPGPRYWQNQADYLIHATLSEKDTSITGDVTLTYTNNSPDNLEYLWLQLDQNLFTAASTGTLISTASDPRFATKDFTSGIRITDVLVTYQGKSYKVQPVITDTRMQVRLNSPVSSKGGIISL